MKKEKTSGYFFRRALALVWLYDILFVLGPGPDGIKQEYKKIVGDNPGAHVMARLAEAKLENHDYLSGLADLAAATICGLGGDEVDEQICRPIVEKDLAAIEQPLEQSHLEVNTYLNPAGDKITLFAGSEEEKIGWQEKVRLDPDDLTLMGISELQPLVDGRSFQILTYDELVPLLARTDGRSVMAILRLQEQDPGTPAAAALIHGQAFEPGQYNYAISQPQFVFAGIDLTGRPFVRPGGEPMSGESIVPLMFPVDLRLPFEQAVSPILRDAAKAQVMFFRDFPQLTGTARTLNALGQTEGGTIILVQVLPEVLLNPTLYQLFQNELASSGVTVLAFEDVHYGSFDLFPPDVPQRGSGQPLLPYSPNRIYHETFLPQLVESSHTKFELLQRQTAAGGNLSGARALYLVVTDGENAGSFSPAGRETVDLAEVKIRRPAYTHSRWAVSADKIEHQDQLSPAYVEELLRPVLEQNGYDFDSVQDRLVLVVEEFQGEITLPFYSAPRLKLSAFVRDQGRYFGILEISYAYRLDGDLDNRRLVLEKTLNFWPPEDSGESYAKSADGNEDDLRTLYRLVQQTYPEFNLVDLTPEIEIPKTIVVSRQHLEDNWISVSTTIPAEDLPLLWRNRLAERGISPERQVAVLVDRGYRPFDLLELFNPTEFLPGSSRTIWLGVPVDDNFEIYASATITINRRLDSAGDRGFAPEWRYELDIASPLGLTDHVRQVVKSNRLAQEAIDLLFRTGRISEWEKSMVETLNTSNWPNDFLSSGQWEAFGYRRMDNFDAGRWLQGLNGTDYPLNLPNGGQVYLRVNQFGAYDNYFSQLRQGIYPSSCWIGCITKLDFLFTEPGGQIHSTVRLNIELGTPNENFGYFSFRLENAIFGQGPMVYGMISQDFTFDEEGKITWPNQKAGEEITQVAAIVGDLVEPR